MVLKMPKVRLQDQAKASIFTCRTFISLKIVVYILFVVKGVFLKELKRLLHGQLPELTNFFTC